MESEAIIALKEIADALPYPGCPYDNKLRFVGVKKETLDTLEKNGYVSSHLGGYVFLNNPFCFKDRWYQLTQKGREVYNFLKIFN